MLIVIGLFAFGVSEALAWSSEQFMFALAFLYAAYNAFSALHPEYSFGRTVAAIHVLSSAGDGRLSFGQAVLRPTTRVVLLFLCKEFGEVFNAEWLVALPIALELGLMAHTPWRQSLADKVAKTIVVIKPPVQPHRAPAYPMYSVKDEEFGPKP
jgi:uncharacterized RDD family membrane protein YckC